MWTWIKRRKFIILAALVLLIVVPSLIVVARSVAAVREFEEQRPMEGAVILDRHGSVIARLGEQGTFVAIGDMPEELTEAVVAVEDARFYRHRGIDIVGIARAAWTNLRAGRTVQGASTITQQLARNIFLYPDRTYTRKLEEVALAMVLETRYSKEQILELYLNQIYFGEGAYGVEAAARTYFGKSVSELDLAESALIAGLPQAPSAYSPYRNLELARNRRNIVLNRMVDTGVVNQAQGEEAKEERIVLIRRQGGPARYFVDWLTGELVAELGEAAVFQGGLRVHTSLDLNMQETAEQIFREQENQGALVALDPQNGQILAMVGGRDYTTSQFNRAVAARRQPGSAIKPIIYGAALLEGLQTNSIVEDIPREFAGYSPANYGEEYWGPVTMKHAIALSLNNAAVWTLNEIGVGQGFRLAQDLGLTVVPEDRNLALALGGLTDGVSPLALTGAYVPFANGGSYYEPSTIVRVVDFQGEVVLEPEPEKQVIFSEQEAFIMTDMLKAVMEYGTGKILEFPRPAAGKTGTTNEQVDLWFMGYTPQIITGVYIGNDNREPLEGFGGTIAGPIWSQFMEEALRDEPARDFPVPDNMVTDIKIDIFSGLLANERCEWVELDVFVEGTQPTRLAPCAEPPRPFRARPPEPSPPREAEPPELPEEEPEEEEPEEEEPEEEEPEEEEPEEPEVPIEPEPTPEPEVPPTPPPTEPEQPEGPPTTEAPPPIELEPEPPPEPEPEVPSDEEPAGQLPPQEPEQPDQEEPAEPPSPEPEQPAAEEPTEPEDSEPPPALEPEAPIEEEPSEPPPPLDPEVPAEQPPAPEPEEPAEPLPSEEIDVE